jgi:hypothetical protein
MDAERGGRELVVSAWPEPPNAKSAGVRCGVQGTFAVGGIETVPTWEGRRRRSSCHLLLRQIRGCFCGLTKPSLRGASTGPGEDSYRRSFGVLKHDALPLSRAEQGDEP